MAKNVRMAKTVDDGKTLEASSETLLEEIRLLKRNRVNEVMRRFGPWPEFQSQDQEVLEALGAVAEAGKKQVQ